MSMQLQAHVKSTSASAAPVFTPVRTGLLQRKCACAGAAGMSGECAECSKKKRFGLQTKLIVTEPGDMYEREADWIADQVLATPAHSDVTGAPPRIQRFAGQSNGLDAAPASVDRVLASPGRPLEPALRQDMEQRFGHDFSRVRVHSGEVAEQSALAMNALAYTVGYDIVLGNGQPLTARRLLAHELAHVIQQNPGINPTGDSASSINITGRTSGSSVVQRALDCDIEHIKKECDGAAASCMSVQKDYCAAKYKGDKEIDQLHKNAVAGAESEKADIPHAAENLLYFLSGSGKEKVMPVDIFKNHKATKDKLADEHRAKFIEGAIKRLKDNRLKAGGSAAMVWTGTASAFDFSKNDLGLAVGGYTLCSKVQVSAKDKGSGDIELTFDDWTVQAFDCYNWDPGKGIGGMFGGVSDKDLCCLQNAGKGKHFRIRTDPWKNDYGPSLAKEIVSISSPPPKSGGSKGSDSR